MAGLIPLLPFVLLYFCSSFIPCHFFFTRQKVKEQHRDNLRINNVKRTKYLFRTIYMAGQLILSDFRNLTNNYRTCS